MQPQDDEFGRFAYGVPPEKNGDYAVLLHILNVRRRASNTCTSVAIRRTGACTWPR